MLVFWGKGPKGGKDDEEDPVDDSTDVSWALKIKFD